MTLKFNVRFIEPARLKPYFRNVKKHGRKQVGKLAAVLKQYDFDQPIVVDSDLVIIKGTGRYLAALYLNKKLVPIIVRDDLQPEEVQALRIIDNRAFELGEIDEAQVQAEMFDFVAEGGEGAEAIFDFLQPPKPPPPPKDGGLKVDTSDWVPQEQPGYLVVCPACAHSEWHIPEGKA